MELVEIGFEIIKLEEEIPYLQGLARFFAETELRKLKKLMEGDDEDGEGKCN